MTPHLVRPSRRAARAALALTVLAGAAACTDKLDTEDPRPIGFVLVDANGDLSATQTRPTVTFIRAFGLNIADTRSAGDTCEVLPFDETPGTPTPVTGVEAGEALALQLSGTTTTLVPTGSTVGRVYAPAAEASVTYHPGDTATVKIPGAAGGFPALDFSIRTAEAVVFDSVLVPASTSTSSVPVTWTAGEATSTMLLSLRYQTPTASGLRQVLCIMRDDGSFSIPASRLTEWRADSTTGRTAVATRARTAGVAVGDATFYGSSQFKKTVPLKTAP